MNPEPAILKDVHNVITSWKGKFHFVSSSDGHAVHLDKRTEHGGDDTGTRPKPLILSSIGVALVWKLFLSSIKCVCMCMNLMLMLKAN